MLKKAKKIKLHYTRDVPQSSLHFQSYYDWVDDRRELQDFVFYAFFVLKTYTRHHVTLIQ